MLLAGESVLLTERVRVDDLLAVVETWGPVCPRIIITGQRAEQTGSTHHGLFLLLSLPISTSRPAGTPLA